VPVQLYLRPPGRGHPAGELLAITGIGQAESLARYARHVGDAPPKAVLRAGTGAGAR
jgi:hypothetical protein